MKYIFTLIASVWINSLCFAQSGSPDLSFGTNGAVSTPAAPGGLTLSIGKQCLRNADGSLMMVFTNNGKTIVSKHRADGTLDATYRNNGYSDLVSLYLTCAVMQADGKIVAGGTTDGASDWMLARFNTDGTLDQSFGNKGVVITDLGSTSENLNAITLDASGRILAAGAFNGSGGGDMATIRYTTAGLPDNSFGTGGTAIVEFDSYGSSVNAIAIQPDNKIVLSGTAYPGFNADFAVARLNSNGTPDLSFNSIGRINIDFGFTDYSTALAIDNAGNIFAGGLSADQAGWQHFRIVKLSSTGVQDATYNNNEGSLLANFGDSYDALSCLRVLPNGKLLAAGRTTPDFNSADIEIIRVTSTGTIDQTFGVNGLLTADFENGIDEPAFLQLDPDNKFRVGGQNYYFTSNSAIYRATCFRFNENGSPDISFGSGGHISVSITTSYLGYSALYEQADGKLLAVSEGTSNMTYYYNMYRYNSNGTPDNTFGQNGKTAIGPQSGVHIFQPDGKLIKIGYSESNNGDVMLMRYNLDGSPDATFGNGGTAIIDLGGTESAGALNFLPGGKILVGGSRRTDTGGDLLLFRLNPNGTVDQTFGTNGYVSYGNYIEDWVQSIAVASDGKIVLGGGGFNYSPDFSYLSYDLQIYRLNADGSLDLTFGNEGKTIIDRTPFDFVGGIAIQNDNKIVISYVGNPTGGREYGYLERLNANGTNDNGFGGTGIVETDGYSLQMLSNQQLLLGGRRKNAQNNDDFLLIQYTKDGIIDPAFGTNGITLASFTSLDNNLSLALVGKTGYFAAGSGLNLKAENLGIIAKFKMQAAASVTCPANKTVNTDANGCTAKVTGIDPTATSGVKYKLTGATVGTGNGTVSGKIFNKGLTTVTYTLLTDATKTCSFTITVQDTQKPVINAVTASPAILWPADHKMKDVTINYTVTDNCQLNNTQLSVTSKEPVQSNERGDQSPDWQIVDNHHVRLRAERLDNGQGRTYTITITATDKSANSSISLVTVKVPKSQSNPNCNLQVNASPNPSSNYFRITLSSSCNDGVDVRILNSNGTVITTKNNLSPNQSFNIGQGYNRGIYYLEAKQAGVTKTIKLIKQ